MLSAKASSSDRQLREQTKALAGLVRRICTVGASLIHPRLADELLRRTGRLVEALAKRDERRYITVTEIAEGIAKELRTRVGEPIARSNHRESPDDDSRFERVVTEVKASTQDYVDFLHIKIHRNVTMTAYLSMFPGLVHFMYVNRSQDVMIAPCLTPGSTTGDGQAEQAEFTTGHADSLKQKVWELYAHAQKRLAQGYTSLAMRAGDFRYMYHLWFEGEGGEPLAPKCELGPTNDALDWNFYRELTSRLFPEARPGAIRCFELYTIHLARVPVEMATAHGSGLVRELRASYPDEQFSRGGR